MLSFLDWQNDVAKNDFIDCFDSLPGEVDQILHECEFYCTELATLASRLAKNIGAREAVDTGKYNLVTCSTIFRRL